MLQVEEAVLGAHLMIAVSRSAVDDVAGDARGDVPQSFLLNLQSLRE